jgi:O-antigen ligase
MPAPLAAFIVAVGILGLFLLDRDRDCKVSPALWLPVLWLAIGGSRNVSVWLGGATETLFAEEYVDGSPLDRVVMSALIAMGLLVLLVRGRRTGRLLLWNVPLVLFFLYCALSIGWADLPLVALRRWTKAFGNLVMVFVVLTDPDPAFAIKKFLTRTAFLLIPTSILLIKYFPLLGRQYDRWEGILSYTGVTTDKNILGLICMVFGFGLLSRGIDIYKAEVRRSREILAVGATFVMVLWLLISSKSATSMACFMVGAALIATLRLFKRARPWMVHVAVIALASVAAVVLLYDGAWTYLAESFGRDATLTGRTDLWADLLTLATKQRWLGTGFESFFLGDRLEILWRKYWWRPNEAHNGYLEIYLTLGIIGVSLLGLVMVTGYRNAIKVYRRDLSAGSLRLAFIIVPAIYNVTEAAFRVTNPIWILFLMAAAAVPPIRQRTTEAASSERAFANGMPSARRVLQPGLRPGPARPLAAWGSTRTGTITVRPAFGRKVQSP